MILGLQPKFTRAQRAAHLLCAAITLLCLNGQAHAESYWDSAASQPGMMDTRPESQRYPWRAHTPAQSSIAIAPKPPEMAADMPARATQPSAAPMLEREPNINHYPDPFAKQKKESFAPWVELQKEAAAGKAMSKPTPFPDKPLEFMVMEIGLRDFLNELTREHGNFSLTIARDVDGTIKNARMTGTLEEIIQKLAREFNFEWMVDGPELYIASRAKNEYKVVKDKRLTEEQFKEALADIYSPNLNYMVKNNRLNSTIDLRGPKDFVKRFEQRFENTEVNQVRMIRAGKVYQE